MGKREGGRGKSVRRMRCTGCTGEGGRGSRQAHPQVSPVQGVRLLWHMRRGVVRGGEREEGALLAQT